MNGSDVLLLSQVRGAAARGETRAVRQAARLSLTEVAAVCGVDQSTVSRWEQGIRSPRGEAGLKYARLIERLRGATDSAGAAS